MNGNALLVKSAVGVCLALVSIAGGALATGVPPAGGVYREFALPNAGASKISGSDGWRCHNPAYLHGFLNCKYAYDIPAGDLTGVQRAELISEIWGGHCGTSGKGVYWNDKPNDADDPNQAYQYEPTAYWPELDTTPAGHYPESYMKQYLSVLDNFPLGKLQAGQNIVSMRCGLQISYSFDWPQWGPYGMILRLHYDAGSKPHATGSITSPAPGAILGENPTIQCSVSGSVARVDYIGYYEGVDENGDGSYLDWHFFYHDNKTSSAGPQLQDHIGTATSAPWSVTWDTSQVPDQAAGSMKIMALITDTSGITYATQVENIGLSRASETVKLYTPYNVPERFWQPYGSDRCNIAIDAGDDLAEAVSAHMHWRTWARIGAEVYVDGQSVGTTQTTDHEYYYTVMNVQPSILTNGQMTVSIVCNDSGHHGCEVMWPGPVLVVRYQKDTTPTAPAIVQEPQDVSALENETATFTVSATGYPDPTYQWRRDGNPIGGATGATYSFQCSLADDGAKFSVVVTNSAGQATSREAALTVTGDATGPKLVSVTAVSTTEVYVVFDEAMGNSANVAASYVITGGSGPGVSSAQLQADGVTVKLALSSDLEEGVEYTLTVTGVTDQAGNTVQAAYSEKAFVYRGGLVGWWKFDDGGGATAADSSSLGNHGTVHGGATWTAGKIGGALSFDGTDDYVSIPNESDYDLAGAVSICVWIKGASGMGNWRGAVTKYDNMNIQRNGDTNSMVWQTSGTSDYQLPCTSDVLDGAWHHVVGTYDGSVKRIYVDGVLEATAPCTGAIDTTNTQVELGRNGRWSSYHWQGMLDDVRIYGRAVALDEVQALYDLGGGGTDPNGKSSTSSGGTGCGGAVPGGASGAAALLVAALCVGRLRRPLAGGRAAV